MKVLFICCRGSEFCECAVDGRSPELGNGALSASIVGNGPSRAFAGLAGRLPGMVSSVVPLLGITASVVVRSICDMSQESNGSERVVSPERTLEARDRVVRESSNFVCELLGLNDSKESLHEDCFDWALGDSDGERGVDTLAKA